MTKEPARRRPLDLMGGPEPDESATDTMAGADPGYSDVMAPSGAGIEPGSGDPARQ